MMKKKISSGTLSLFPEETERSPYVEKNQPRLRRWASKGVRLGCSSWKYPGWKGLIYNKSYQTKKTFEQQCLVEYSELFPTVCADFALYDFPDPEKMHVIHEQTADDFKVSLKVTDRITVKRFPNLPRFGVKAGTLNPDFLNVELFQDAFLKPIEQLRQKKGVIIFEFSTFYANSGVNFETFVEMMDDFLAQLPKDYEYAIEVRNSEFLTDEYLKMLESHGVAHVLNSWTKMPPIIEQLQIAGTLTAKFSVSRALLKPGRTYQEAVEMFSPYTEIKEVNKELRMGIIEAVQRCLADGRTLYAYINNRAEGNSPKTIEEILNTLDNYPNEKL